MNTSTRHARKRVEIIEATWRMIVRGGFAAATMREIAAEASLANGSLKSYFASKDELVQAAFQHTFDRIDERANEATAGESGLLAIRRLCLEMLPLDAERAVEARVTIALLDRAASDRTLMAMQAEATDRWRRSMVAWLNEARTNGQVGGSGRDGQIIELLLAITSGLRTASVLDTGTGAPTDLAGVLDLAISGLAA